MHSVRRPQGAAFFILKSKKCVLLLAAAFLLRLYFRLALSDHGVIGKPMNVLAGVGNEVRRILDANFLQSGIDVGQDIASQRIRDAFRTSHDGAYTAELIESAKSSHGINAVELGLQLVGIFRRARGQWLLRHGLRRHQNHARGYESFHVFLQSQD